MKTRKVNLNIQIISIFCSVLLTFLIKKCLPSKQDSYAIAQQENMQDKTKKKSAWGNATMHVHLLMYAANMKPQGLVGAGTPFQFLTNSYYYVENKQLWSNYITPSLSIDITRPLSIFVLKI